MSCLWTGVVIPHRSFCTNQFTLVEEQSYCLWNSKKGIFFIYNGDAFASTEVYQEIHIPQLILVSSQPLSQQEMLSWKSCSISTALPGLLSLSLPALSLFPACSSSCPLQLLLLFSLTPNYLFPLCLISSHCLYWFQTTFLPHLQAEPLVQSQQLGCTAEFQQGIPLLSRWKSSFSKDSSPCPFWFLCCDYVLNCSKP